MNPVETPRLPLLERAICSMFPGWYARREEARLRIDYMASYSGGIATRTSNAYSRASANSTGSSANRRLLGNMRGRAQQMYLSNAVARTIIDTEADNIIADGFCIEPRTESAEFNKEAKERWYQWMDVADIRGLRTGGQLQSTVWKTHRVDGAIGVVLVDQGGESRLQLITAERICNPDGKADSPTLLDGIELDAQAKPIAFHVLNTTDWTTRTWTRVTADNIVWLPNLNDADPLQTGGETALATIFTHLENLDQYVDGVALAAWMATVFGIIFREKSAGKQLGQLPFLQNSDGKEQRALRLENGSVKYIAPEGEVVQVDAKQPMQQTPEFIRTMLRLIGMPFQMPLELIAKDMSTVNFASARIGLLGFYRACRVKQERFVSRFLDRVYQWWLSRERKKQALGIDGAFVTAFPERFWPHDFHSRGWDYTDPVSEAQGDLLEITMGTKSPQMVAAERGRDLTEVMADIAVARLMRDGHKLPKVLSSSTRDEIAPAPAAPAQPEIP
jgi:lambda family phage portal protein